MHRRSFLKTASVAGIAAGFSSLLSAESQSAKPNQSIHAATSTRATSDAPNTILLKDYRPKSIYKIPVTEIAKAKFPIIDMHSHPYAKTTEEIAQWVRTMDEVGLAQTIILTMATGKEFDEISQKYSKHSGRFEMWCGLDFTGYDKPGFPAAAMKELERCHSAGARGVGEIHDKGRSLVSGKSKTTHMHPDDPRMDPVFEKCAELRMPVSIHVADPIWMYQKMDKTNDGLMNAYEWRLDNQPDIVGLAGMVDILERTVQKHRSTTFIACHFANLGYDLTHLGEVLDSNPNLYADISARYGETGPIPRCAAQFYARHADRLVYGTDMGFDKEMYKVTFRILETLDEHFYEFDQFGYHWALNGFGLPNDVLKQVYQENAAKIMAARDGAS